MKPKLTLIARREINRTLRRVCRPISGRSSSALLDVLLRVRLRCSLLRAPDLGSTSTSSFCRIYSATGYKLKRVLACGLLGACLTVGSQTASIARPVAKHTVGAPVKGIPDLIAALGDVTPAVRKAAAEKLAQFPRQRVVETAVSIVQKRRQASVTDSHLFSTQAVALDLLQRLDSKRAAALALRQLDTDDADLRETASAIVAALPGDGARDFLVRALRLWGTDNVAGIRAVASGLDRERRAENENAREAITSVLMREPLPRKGERLVYRDQHEPPQDGDLYRCWQFKADACLTLVSRHPFAGADAGVRRCLLIDELRVAAAIALARLRPSDASAVIRLWIERDANREHRLGLYRALFVAGGDNEQDRLTARDMFTATAAPSPAWVQGLGAMVALFEARADEPALRVVSLWKLSGTAAAMRDAALDAMKRSNPEVVERVLGKDYVPPTP